LPKTGCQKISSKLAYRLQKISFLKKNLKENNENRSSIGAAFKLSTELVSAVAVGTIIGFILDKTFGTKPWLILIFFFVGVVAGIINVVRSAKNMQK
jgi:ATP synthase protein I